MKGWMNTLSLAPKWETISNQVLHVYPDAGEKLVLIDCGNKSCGSQWHGSRGIANSRMSEFFSRHLGCLSLFFRFNFIVCALLTLKRHFLFYRRQSIHHQCDPDKKSVTQNRHKISSFLCCLQSQLRGSTHAQNIPNKKKKNNNKQVHFHKNLSSATWPFYGSSWNFIKIQIRNLGFKFSWGFIFYFIAL